MTSEANSVRRVTRVRFPVSFCTKKVVAECRAGATSGSVGTGHPSGVDVVVAHGATGTTGDESTH